jgi:hypothetical protein
VRTRKAYLLFMRLMRLMLWRSKLGASSFFLPLYVAVYSSQGIKIVIFESSLFAVGIMKSYSCDTVDCSRPLSGFGGSRLSLRMKVYCLLSIFSITSSMPSYAERFHFLPSPVVRWLAKPAPPRVLMSRVPRNVAIAPDDEQSR